MDSKILPITADVQWIGVLDPDIKTFDIVMETKYGATYNSYFINADKKCIVENSKRKVLGCFIWLKYLKLLSPKKLSIFLLITPSQIIQEV